MGDKLRTYGRVKRKKIEEENQDQRERGKQKLNQRNGKRPKQ